MRIGGIYMENDIKLLCYEYLSEEEIKEIIDAYQALNIVEFSSFDMVKSRYESLINNELYEESYFILIRFFDKIDEIVWNERIAYRQELREYRRRLTRIRKAAILFTVLLLSAFLIFRVLNISYDVSKVEFILVGEDTMFVEVGDEFYDPGISDNDPNPRSHLYQIVGKVNVTKVGTYRLRYIVDGFTTDLVRTVHVVYSGEPKLELNGPSTVYITSTDEYIEYGVRMIGESDILKDVTIDKSFDEFSSEGEYTVSYIYEDEDGIIVTAFRNVIVSVTESTHSNIVVFARFNDETQYRPKEDMEYYYDLFMGDSYSVKDYFIDSTYNQIIMDSYFINDVNSMYTDVHDRGYYEVYTDDNQIGYLSEGEKYIREQELVSNIISYIVETGYDDSIDMDINNDLLLDSLTILFSKKETDWAELLWPHQYQYQGTYLENKIFNPTAPKINNEYFGDYIFLFLDSNYDTGNTELPGVFVHELFHTYNAPDLYHFYKDKNIDPVGQWGLMGLPLKYAPLHPLQYIKQEYGEVDVDEIYVDDDSVITLNKTTMRFDHAIEIDIPDSDESIWIEYRTRDGFYEKNLLKEGVIVYRVNPNIYGNKDGLFNQDVDYVEEVFVFRPTVFLENILPIEYYIIKNVAEVDYAALRPGRDLEVGLYTDIPLFDSLGREIMITISILEYNEDNVVISIDYIEVE